MGIVSVPWLEWEQCTWVRVGGVDPRFERKGREEPRDGDGQKQAQLLGCSSLGPFPVDIRLLIDK